jgi:hypothetical protein
MTKTSPEDEEDAMPSSSASSCETMRSITPPESPCAPRLGATESSSSKKTTQGRASRARWKTRRNVRLGLADVHVEQLGALDGEEVQRARCRDCFGEQRLASSRRSVE